MIGQHFGDEKCPCVLAGDHAADQTLGTTIAIHFRCIDQPHTESETRSESVLLNCFEVSSLRKMPRALTDGRHRGAVGKLHNTFLFG